MEGRVFEHFQKKTKNFQSSKKAENRYQSVQTCFEIVLGQIFPKKLLSQCSMEGRVFENFQKKNKDFSKFQKSRKSLPKVSKRVLKLFWGKFFQKNCYPSVPWRLESSKIFKKIKKNSKFQKCPKSFPKVSKRVLNVFWSEFFEKFLPSFPWKFESSKNFSKTKKFQSSKNAQNRSQKYPNVF